MQEKYSFANDWSNRCYFLWNINIWKVSDIFFCWFLRAISYLRHFMYTKIVRFSVFMWFLLMMTIFHGLYLKSPQKSTVMSCFFIIFNMFWNDFEKITLVYLVVCVIFWFKIFQFLKIFIIFCQKRAIFELFPQGKIVKF